METRQLAAENRPINFGVHVNKSPGISAPTKKKGTDHDFVNGRSTKSFSKAAKFTISVFPNATPQKAKTTVEIKRIKSILGFSTEDWSNESKRIKGTAPACLCGIHSTTTVTQPVTTSLSRYLFGKIIRK